jgi:small GTP-binding protein
MFGKMRKTKENGPGGTGMVMPPATKSHTYHSKLVILGDTAVGKSCLVLRYVRDDFSEFQESTIGAAFLAHTADLGTEKVKFEIWDTAGQERYKSLAPMYYRGAAAAVIVYDITSKDSFSGAKSWVRELERRAGTGIVIALAGNKSDMESNRRIEFEEVSAYAKENGLLHFETSAKTGANVQELFTNIATNIPKTDTPRESVSFPISPPSRLRRLSRRTGPFSCW